MGSFINPRIEGMNTEAAQLEVTDFALLQEQTAPRADAVALIRRDHPMLARSIELCWGSVELQTRLSEVMLGQAGLPPLKRDVAYAVMRVANEHMDLFGPF